MTKRFIAAARQAAVLTIVAASLVFVASASGQSMTPSVGMKAADFTLPDAVGAKVSLAGELARGPIVLIVGRGWPGYQCPFCTRQFAEFRSHAKELQQAGARVLWIYPGPAEELAKHASDFVGTTEIPSNFRVLIDPGYLFTNAYGLRWDAKNETAYPATFVIDRAGVIQFAKVSHEHGGRTTVPEVLGALGAMMR